MIIVIIITIITIIMMIIMIMIMILIIIIMIAGLGGLRRNKLWNMNLSPLLHLRKANVKFHDLYPPPTK